MVARTTCCTASSLLAMLLLIVTTRSSVADLAETAGGGPSKRLAKVSSEIATWSSFPDSRPPIRGSAGLIYDPRARRLIVFGGQSSTSDVWQLPLAGPSRWSVLETSGPSPSIRWRHTAVYDSKLHRLIAFGGRIPSQGVTNEVWALSLADPTPTWSQLEPLGDSPSPRENHSAIYDPVGNRVAVFGGEDDGVLAGSAVWFLRLGAPVRWELAVTEGDSPESRSSHAALYDPNRLQMIVSGGDGVSGTLDRFHALSLADGGTLRWTELPGSPRLARSRHAVVFDPARDEIISYGGQPWNTSDLDNLIIYSLTQRTWRSPVSRTPPPFVPSGRGRISHQAVVDPVGDRAIFFSDIVYADPGETWAAGLGDTTTWKALAPPPQRPVLAAWAHDTRRDRLLLGFDDFPSFSVWALYPGDPPTWEQVAPPGAAPFEGSGKAGAYDPVRDRFLIFGGDGRRDLWALHLGQPYPLWEQVHAIGPPPPGRYQPSAAYDPIRDRLLVTGGYEFDVCHGCCSTHGNFDLANLIYHSDTWALTLGPIPWWSRIADGPSAAGVATVFDPVRDRLLYFGGDWASNRCDCSTQRHFFDNVWTLDMEDGSVWSPLEVVGTPPTPRTGAAAVFDSQRDRFLLFGGFTLTADGGTCIVQYERSTWNDVWSLSFEPEPVWSQIESLAPRPIGRMNAAAFYHQDSDQLYVMGGRTFESGNDHQDGVWTMRVDAPTPVLISLAEATAEDGRARIVWVLGSRVPLSGTVLRFGRESTWMPRADVTSTGDRIIFLDDDVEAGRRYGFRLVLNSGVSSPDVWVEMPDTPTFALHGPRPHPSTRQLTVAFSLPDHRPSTLELLDLGGRRVLERDVGNLGPGNHSVTLASTRTIRPGVYWVRLQHGQAVRTAKAVVIE